jgi:Mg-chelatase subunit ChlD
MRVLYKKWQEEGFVDSLEFSNEMSKFLDKLFSNSNPASQMENMLKYGFNFGDQSVMGMNDILRQIRKKKLEEMRKNISETYQKQVSNLDRAREEELEEVNKKIPEKISNIEKELSSMAEGNQNEGTENQSDKETGGQNQAQIQALKDLMDQLSQDLAERNEMLSWRPKSFKQGMEQLQNYDEKKGFISEKAKEIFQELLKNFNDIQRLGEFLKKHLYGFKEGDPLTLPEAMEVIDRFEKLEQLEEKLKQGEIQDIPQDIASDVLDKEEFRSLNTIRKIVEVLKESGFFVMKGNSLILTPKGVRKIGDKVIKDIFVNVKSRLFGLHSTKRRGNYEVNYEERKKWEFGDNINIDIFSSLKNAIMEGRFDKKGRIYIEPDDFEVYRNRHFSRVSSALLIDTSWSMSWGGKFECAKKVAIALHSLISSYFPSDKLYIIGFFTVAVEIKPHELPSVELNMNDPFTNMQDAIRLSRKLLKRSPSEEKQIIMITDGQPTAYCVGSRVFVEWPIMGCSPNAMRETIKEVEEATRENIKINIFMIEDNPQVQKFVEEVVRINKGRAFFTTPENLGKYVLLDFVSRRKKLIR